MTDRPDLHLVPGGDDGAPDSDLDHDAAQVQDAEVEARDPLLARAERIADLPLGERPAAFDGLNRAVVAELNHLDEG